MHPFDFAHARDEAGALAAAGEANTRFLAGGTTLLDLMKLHVETPARLVDIGGLKSLSTIESTPDGGLRIGANARNTAVACHEGVCERYPVLSQAILSGASAQIRNMATVGGNLMQRTRCPYFRDISSACNKRNPGSGCDMRQGYNRIAAVLGTSEECVASYPGDMAVALLSLDAVVEVRNPKGLRQIPIGEFHLPPGDSPERETALEPGELITAVVLPPIVGQTRQTYVKVRDRASFDFALASVAAVLWTEGGVIDRARISLGGVGTIPWRAREAEEMLTGRPPGSALFRAAAEAALAAARPLEHNAFKVELARRTIQRALEELTEVA